MNKFFLAIICLSLAFCIKVFAASYSSDTNLFENSYSNNLIDMAESQIDNFSNLKYAIFQNGYNYYLIASSNVSVNNNNITFSDSTIISAIRNQSTSYNYYYTYSTSTESTTILSSNYLILSNIDFSHSVSSSRFNTYQTNFYLKLIGTFIVGLLFAMFLSKERSI